MNKIIKFLSGVVLTLAISLCFSKNSFASDVMLSSDTTYEGGWTIDSTDSYWINNNATVTVNGDLTIKSSLVIADGTLIVNGNVNIECSDTGTGLQVQNSSATISVSGDVNVFSGKFYIAYASLINVDGDINVSGKEGRQGSGNFCMYDKASVVSCRTLYLYTATQPTLKYGTLQISKDLIVTMPASGSATFVPRDEFVIQFKGLNSHTVTLPNSAEGFLYLSSDGPLEVTKYFRATWLNSDLVINAPENGLLINGHTYLNGHSLTVNGDVVLLANSQLRVEKDTDNLLIDGNLFCANGIAVFMGGTTNIKKDLNVTLVSNYGQGTGSITLWSDYNYAAPQVYVDGNVRFKSSNISKLEGGRLVVGGDLFLDDENTSGKSNFILASGCDNEIEFKNAATITLKNLDAKINTLILDKDYKNYTFSTENCWNSIILKSISMEDCVFEQSFTKAEYTGDKITPNVTAKLLQNQEISVDAFTLTYENNILPGIAKIVIAGCNTATNCGYGTASLTFDILPNAPKKVVTSNSSAGTTVSWEKVAGATGYYVYRGSSKVATVKTNSYLDKKAKTNGKSYKYYVVAYKDAKVKTLTSGKSSLKESVFLSANKLSTVKSSKAKTAVLTYTKNNKATGYEIQYSTKKNFKSGVKTASVTGQAKVSATITKLSRNKTYYFRVRAYKKTSSGMQYSDWSNVKSVKVK